MPTFSADYLGFVYLNAATGEQHKPAPAGPWLPAWCVELSDFAYLNAATGALLPSEWRVGLEDGCCYFKHRSTGRLTWEDPTGLPAPWILEWCEAVGVYVYVNTDPLDDKAPRLLRQRPVLEKVDDEPELYSHVLGWRRCWSAYTQRWEWRDETTGHVTRESPELVDAGPLIAIVS